MERKTGFYWCNLGTLRGTPSGWMVCYFQIFGTQGTWHVPVYNNAVRQFDELRYFEEIDERILFPFKKLDDLRSEGMAISQAEYFATKLEAKTEELLKCEKRIAELENKLNFHY